MYKCVRLISLELNCPGKVFPLFKTEFNLNGMLTSSKGLTDTFSASIPKTYLESKLT